MRSRLFLAALVGLWACGESPASPNQDEAPGDGLPTPQVGAVQVTSPIGALMAVGRGVSLEASVVSTTGGTMQASVTWASTNTTVAAVSATGRVTGLAAGGATITATAGGVQGAVALTVVASDLGAIGTLLGDPLPDRLFAALGGDAEGPLRATWSLCADGVASGNVLQVYTCVSDARSGLAAVSAPEDRPTAGLLSLFVDWIEHHLNLG